MSENQVKQWLTLQNGLDKVYQGTAPIPSPGENEVLVEIRAVSLNYRDTEGPTFPFWQVLRICIE